MKKQKIKVNTKGGLLADMKDMVEWDIKATSDNCKYRVHIEYHHCGAIEQCDHFNNPSKACLSKACPIIIKDKK